MKNKIEKRDLAKAACESFLRKIDRNIFEIDFIDDELDLLIYRLLELKNDK